MAGFQFVKVSSSNYFCFKGKLIGSEAATLFIPRRYAAPYDLTRKPIVNDKNPKKKPTLLKIKRGVFPAHLPTQKHHI